ncbi:MAG: MFS transporter [Demequinaceae bacterium]|nr:MFS transporter [Demequinaceae bacterium]
MGSTPWRPWKFVLWLGVASMLADIAYEGARSITGPYLASLGASAVVVGAVTGAGEAVSLAGRLVSGPIADKTRAYWRLLLGGYVLTVVSVPLLGLSSVVWIVSGLILAERAGKAIRRPAKDVILSHATSAIGRGRGFAVHEALDQLGAVAGPLAVAAAFAVTGRYAPTFGMLAVPGVAVIILLLWLRNKVPDPSVFEPVAAETVEDPPAAVGLRRSRRSALGRPFWWYLSFAALSTVGYSTFGVLAFHLDQEGLVSTAWVPVVYAAAMAVDALAALVAGSLFDRVGRRVLVVVPFLAAAVPPLAFSSRLSVAIAGILVWAGVLGIQESVMRAAVADLIPVERRGTAYGVFAAGIGLAAFAGGVLTGALYETSLPLLIGVVGAVEAASIAVYVVWSRRLSSAVP